MMVMMMMMMKTALAANKSLIHRFFQETNSENDL
jgi:hypothetical protein